MTTAIAMSRRGLLAAGLGSLAVACKGTSSPSSNSNDQEQLLKRWYAEWTNGNKDWSTLDAMLTDDFTFSSAAGDDHISKATFKKQCWETQIGFIDRMDLESMFENANEAFVKYLGHTKNGKSFRNVEHFTFRDNKIAALECYFGQESSFPSAVSKG
jgi:ketosteroid isomerase-like protein